MKTSDQRKCSWIALAEAYVDKSVAGKEGSTKYQYRPTSADEKSNAPWDGLVDLWRWEFNSSVASIWFGLRHARIRNVVVLQRTVVSRFGCFIFEVWVLRFWVLGAPFSSFGCSAFESWVLRFRDLGALFSRFGCSAFESWVLRFQDLGASFLSLGCSVFKIWVLRFRDLGALFSRFGCFVLRSSFSSASFSKLPKIKKSTT